MKIATWNVNGFRARETELLQWVDREQPDVFCLQEIKAQITQLPLAMGALAVYDSYFHGSGGYSGVSIHVKKNIGLPRPTFAHPTFDFETRIVEAQLGDVAIASVYVPNGGKDYPAKLRFLEAMIAWAAERDKAGKKLVIAGDLNVAHRTIDVHETERKPKAVGQRPEERALFDRLLGAGLVDVTRQLHPEDDALFTWWPYWREARQRNVGWRIDYVLASAALASRVTSVRVQRDFGASDHAPLVCELASLGE